MFIVIQMLEVVGGLATLLRTIVMVGAEDVGKALALERKACSAVEFMMVVVHSCELKASVGVTLRRVLARMYELLLSILLKLMVR